MPKPGQPTTGPEMFAARPGFASAFARSFARSIDFHHSDPKPVDRVASGLAKLELEQAVDLFLGDLNASLPEDWHGHDEVEPIPPELTDTFEVAFASARKNCRHENSHSTTLSRNERQCDDCGKYFKRKGLFDL